MQTICRQHLETPAIKGVLRVIFNRYACQSGQQNAKGICEVKGVAEESSLQWKWLLGVSANTQNLTFAVAILSSAPSWPSCTIPATSRSAACSGVSPTYNAHRWYFIWFIYYSRSARTHTRTRTTTHAHTHTSHEIGCGAHMLPRVPQSSCFAALSEAILVPCSSVESVSLRTCHKFKGLGFTG